MIMRACAFLLFLLWGIFCLDADGSRPARASEGDLERTEEFGPCWREADPIANTAQANYRCWNVYLEWIEPGFSGRRIFQEMRTNEDPTITPFFSPGFFQGIESKGRYTLLEEGEIPLSQASGKERSEPQRDWKGIGRDTAFYMGYQAVVSGVMYILPESMTQWTQEQKNARFEKWVENVQNPVWDEDTWWINYLAHPYFGATYYIRARERGFGEFGSFWYSALLSSLWEFGIEAFFEPPSYQDLIVTPTGGFLVGKYVFEPIRENIKAKAQLKWYDHAGLILTDPLGAVNSIFERALGIRSTIRVQFHSPNRTPMAVAPPAGTSLEWQDVRFSLPDGASIQLRAEWK